MGLFEAIRRQYDKRESCVLAVVVETNGSTPREAGSYMLVSSKGRIWGTVGGGVTEYEVQLIAQKQLELKQNKVCDFSLMPAEDKLCGGEQKILLHYIDMDEAISRQAIAEVLAVADSNKPFWLEIPYEGGRLKSRQDVHTSVAFDDKDDSPLIKQDNAQQKAKRCQNVLCEGQKYYIEQFNYDGIVYVLGGGHVAQALVPLLTKLDFSCIVVDDRDEFVGAALFPDAKASFKVDYERLEEYLQVNANDYVCIMTRAHTYDAECERFALKTATDYIGVMGSKFKARLTREKLLQEGFSEQDISRVVTPIGISLPCETPMEIAVSIAAQLIKVRAERYK